MNSRLLTEHQLQFLSLKGGCTCSSESILVKVSHCWKAHVVAHMYILAYIAMGLADCSNCQMDWYPSSDHEIHFLVKWPDNTDSYIYYLCINRVIALGATPECIVNLYIRYLHVF